MIQDPISESVPLFKINRNSVLVISLPLRTMKQITFLLSIVVCISISTNAQTTSTTTSSNDLPVWVKMMEDENVNYFEAVEAYNLYLKIHPMPGEEVEEELMGGDEASKEEYEREMKRENKKIKTEEQRRELVQREQISYQAKRFRNWMQEVKPFVQEDGHILTQSERNSIWMKQQEEIKNSPTNKK